MNTFGKTRKTVDERIIVVLRLYALGRIEKRKALEEIRFITGRVKKK